MAVDFPSDSTRQLRSVFSSGLTDDCGDGELLDRFVAARDEAASRRSWRGTGRWSIAFAGRRSAIWTRPPMHTRLCSSSSCARRLRCSCGLRWRAGSSGSPLGLGPREGRRRTQGEKMARPAPRACDPRPASGRDEPRDAIMALHEELLRLPDRYREVVVLCHLEGHTCEAAARRIRRPVGTVKARLSRARTAAQASPPSSWARRARLPAGSRGGRRVCRRGCRTRKHATDLDFHRGPSRRSLRPGPGAGRGSPRRHGSSPSQGRDRWHVDRRADRRRSLSWLGRPRGRRAPASELCRRDSGRPQGGSARPRVIPSAWHSSRPSPRPCNRPTRIS